MGDGRAAADKEDMDKNGKKPAGTIRQFFRRVSLLGILLAGGILIYSANREDIGSLWNAPQKEKEEETMVRKPTERPGMESTPHGMRVHRVAYAHSEGGEGEAETTAETTSSTMAENPSEGTAETEGISDGVVEIPGMEDSPTVGTDPEESMLPSLPDESGGPDWGAIAAMGEETTSSPMETSSESAPMVTSEPAVEKESTPSSPEPFPPSAPPAPAPSPVTPPPASASPAPPNLPPLVKDGSHPLKNVAGPPVQNFLEIFDFNVDPDWVTSRWSYVTSVGPLNTRGYRVPLCTGIDKSDLVGNLTYYFNNKLEVEKITFEGYTGDMERLLITLRYFHMAKRITSDPNVILYESPTLANNYQSYMRSYHRTTPLDGETPHHRFWITMELYPEDED